MKNKITIIRPNLWARAYHLSLKPWVLRRVTKRYREREKKIKQIVEKWAQQFEL